nr:hypothetical protein [Listeria costaricensis]
MRYILPGQIASCQYVAEQTSQVILLKKTDVLAYVIGQGDAWFLVDQLQCAHQKVLAQLFS